MPVFQAAPTVEDISSALKTRRFAEAIAAADAVLAARDASADHVTYLKALAMFHAKIHQGCVQTAGEDALAMQRFEAFLRAHPLDGRSPRILYIQGVMHEAKAIGLEESKAAAPEVARAYRSAIAEWGKLISKYPESDEAAAAQLFPSCHGSVKPDPPPPKSNIPNSTPAPMSAPARQGWN